jgi:hypothetical protein
MGAKILMLEFPLYCSTCHREVMVDMEALIVRPVDQVVSVEEFICPYCESREPVFYTTVSLQKKLGSLQRMKPDYSKYRYHFANVLDKARNLQARMRRRDGPSKDQNLAAAGQVV